MANLKQFVLVSAYLIALLLPLWHGAEAINYAWKLGEEWLKEKPQIGTLAISNGGWGIGIVRGNVVYNADIACSTSSGAVWSVPGSVPADVARELTRRVEHIQCSVGTSNTINLPSTTQLSPAEARMYLGLTVMGKPAEDPDGWPNERDCPMDKEKGVRVCK